MLNLSLEPLCSGYKIRKADLHRMDDHRISRGSSRLETSTRATSQQVKRRCTIRPPDTTLSLRLQEAKNAVVPEKNRRCVFIVLKIYYQGFSINSRSKRKQQSNSFGIKIWISRNGWSVFVVSHRYNFTIFIWWSKIALIIVVFNLCLVENKYWWSYHVFCVRFAHR